MGTSGLLGCTTRVIQQEHLPSLVGRGTLMTWHGGAGQLHQHSHDVRHHPQAHMLAAHMSSHVTNILDSDVKLSTDTWLWH
jgi:hypothetical protein